jgi:glycosyltransferase involved in cell wall biosynthesis
VRNDIATLRLLKALKMNEYEVIHCFEIQHAGYALENSIQHKHIPKKTKVIVSCWGSDIYWFMNNEIHRRKISQLLNKTNLLILDTNRDIELSRSLGYTGKIFRVNSHAGGIDSSEMISSSYIDFNSRKSIIIKGHFGFVGRPFFSIDVLMDLAHLVNQMDLNLHIISCPPSIIPMIEEQLENYNVKYKIYRPYELSRFDLIKLYRTSKMCIANSLSDGIPTTAIESMANGCVPIQSNTSSLLEWGVDPRIVLPPLEGGLWRNTIQHFLNNEEELKIIAKKNLKITQENFSVAVIRNQIAQVYELF